MLVSYGFGICAGISLTVLQLFFIGEMKRASKLAFQREKEFGSTRSVSLEDDCSSSTRLLLRGIRDEVFAIHDYYQMNADGAEWSHGRSILRITSYANLEEDIVPPGFGIDLNHHHPR